MYQHKCFLGTNWIIIVYPELRLIIDYPQFVLIYIPMRCTFGFAGLTISTNRIGTLSLLGKPNSYSMLDAASCENVSGRIAMVGKYELNSGVANALPQCGTAFQRSKRIVNPKKNDIDMPEIRNWKWDNVPM